MLRKLSCAAAVLAMALGAALAQNQGTQGQMQGGRIMTGQGGKFTYMPYDTKGQTFGKQAQPFPTAVDDIKVYRMKGTERTPVQGGLTGDAFKNIGDQGLYATWRMQGDRVSEVYLWENEQAFQKGLTANPGGDTKKQ